MIRLSLVLAHGPDKPEGDVGDRMVMTVALTAQGQIDAQSYDQAATPWLAERQRDGLPPRALEIIRLDEGWALQSTNSLDDPISVFEGVVFRPGELVTIRRPNGDHLLYRIVNSEPA